MMRLAPCEFEVMGKLCEGKSNKVIARERGISPLTVKNQVHRILWKLGALNRAHAVAIWLQKK